MQNKNNTKPYKIKCFTTNNFTVHDAEMFCDWLKDDQKFGSFTHPFILHPRSLQFLEICFKKSDYRNLVQEKWLTRKKGGFIL